jgi:hypothetical protein
LVIRFICDYPNFGGDGGSATNALLGYPQGVALDGQGNLYIADYCNRRIRKVDTRGLISTVAGNGIQGQGGDEGSATLAHLKAPLKIATDVAGDLYIADFNAIRRMDTRGWIITVAGKGTGGRNGAPATSADLDAINGATTDFAGNFYLSTGNIVSKVNVGKSAVLFAAHTVGTTSPERRILLTDIGNLSLNLGTTEFTGPFDMLSDDQPSYCSTNPGLNPGFSCALPITFTPPDAGSFTGTATVTNNSLNQPGTTQSIALSGTGVNP